MKALFLALIALAMAVPLQAASVVAEPFPPARFSSLYIERDENVFDGKRDHKGTVTTVQAVGDAVLYKVTTDGKETENVTVHPCDDDWFNFIQALNSAHVYKWAPKYYYPGQGAVWVIDLTMEDRKFNSEGTNEYPLNGDETQPQANPQSGPSVPYQLFWQAVLKLVGKAPLLAPPK